MIVADLHDGNGVTVVDPHGSLIDDLLAAIPPSRTNEVIYLDPAHAVLFLSGIPEAIIRKLTGHRSREIEPTNICRPASRTRQLISSHTHFPERVHVQTPGSSSQMGAR